MKFVSLRKLTDNEEKSKKIRQKTSTKATTNAENSAVIMCFSVFTAFLVLMDTF